MFDFSAVAHIKLYYMS